MIKFYFREKLKQLVLGRNYKNFIKNNSMKIGKAIFKEGTSKRAITSEIEALISNDNFWAIGNFLLMQIISDTRNRTGTLSSTISNR